MVISRLLEFPCTDRPDLLRTRPDVTAHPDDRTDPDAPKGVAAAASLDLHAIFTAYFDVVWHHLRRMGVPQADRDDLAQDVFCVVHRRLATYDPSRPMRAWLLGIATHLVLHRWRAARRHPVDLGIPDAVLETAEAGFASEAHDRQDARRTLAALLVTLEPRQRAMFVLHELEGFSAPEIAGLLEMPLNTVYSRLRRTRLQLTALARRWQNGVP